MKIQERGVLPLLPSLLQPQSSCSTRVANIIAEVAKNGMAGSASSTHLLRGQSEETIRGDSQRRLFLRLSQRTV